VAYTPDWERLADALKRVIAAGVAEEEAKTDLCRAVADRKINVRVRIAATDYGMRGRLFCGGNVGVPAHLEPQNFDWVQSRPLAQWPIGPKLGEHYVWIGGWENRPFDLIELRTADVIEVLCGAGGNATSPATVRQEADATKALASHLKNNPQIKKADAAAWCRESGFNVGQRGFQNRVWPRAREQAGLGAKAPPGPKPPSR
jgi:hypothetical protein